MLAGIPINPQDGQPYYLLPVSYYRMASGEAICDIGQVQVFGGEAAFAVG